MEMKLPFFVRVDFQFCSEWPLPFQDEFSNLENLYYLGNFDNIENF